MLQLLWLCGQFSFFNLWAQVFSFLGNEYSHFSTWSDKEAAQDVGERLTLRLVCKQFDALRLQHLKRLSLRSDTCDHALSNLLALLQRSKVCLSIFEANCGDSVLDEVLGALAALLMPLTVIDITGFKQCSLAMLSACRSLQHCCLTSDSCSCWTL